MQTTRRRWPGLSVDSVSGAGGRWAGGRVELLAGPAGRACLALPVPVAVQLTGGVPRPHAQGIRITGSVRVHTRPGVWGISFRDTLLALWISLWMFGWGCG